MFIYKLMCSYVSSVNVWKTVLSWMENIMKSQMIICAIIGLLLTFGCYKNKSSCDTARAAYPSIASINEAMARAKSTSADFVHTFHARKPGTRDFFVKKAYIGISGGEEHIWIKVIDEQGGVCQGVAYGHTERTQGGVKLGQKVSVKITEISDWKYKDGNKLIGGYTLRYYIDTMPISSKERAAFLRKVGFEP